MVGLSQGMEKDLHEGIRTALVPPAPSVTRPEWTELTCLSPPRPRPLHLLLPAASMRTVRKSSSARAPSSPGNTPPHLLPAGFRARLGAVLDRSFPHGVGQGVANGGHDHDQLERPVVQVQGAHAGEVGAQVAVDAGALDADERTQVQAGPVGVCQKRGVCICSGLLPPLVTGFLAWPNPEAP